MIITLLISVALLITVILLAIMVNYFINDYDQSTMADEYSEKAKRHNELMVKKESRNGSSSR